MKMFHRTRILLVAGLLGGSIALAHEEMKSLRPNSKEFELMKPLVGVWKGTSMHPDAKDQKLDPVATSFKVTAGGSAIEETLMAGTPGEMVDMYHDEGGKLVMTHYCAMGNQPHMVLKKAGPGMVSFEMGPTPGIDAGKDVHMHAMTLEFPDANHLTERWTSYENGKPGVPVVFNLTRAK